MRRIIGLALALLLAPLAWADNYNGAVINKTAAAVAFTEDIDLAALKIERLSVQGVYSDGTPSGHTVSDGTKGTASLTVLSTTSLTGKTITFGDTVLTFGSDISTGPATGNTTVIISTTIAAALQSSDAGDLVTFSTGLVGGFGVVTATTTNPSSYAPLLLASSTNTVWTWPYLLGGADPAIDVDDDTFTKADHGLTTGLRVWVSTTAGTIPTGLTMGTTYFAIRVNNSEYQVATSSTNAVAGTEVDITRVIGSGTVTVNPLALSLVTGSTNNTGFKWQASNDGTNYSDLVLSSVTYSASGNTLWDLGEPNYRYLRMNFTGPTSGGLLIQGVVNGTR